MFAITGITGKVGGTLARALLAAGQPVRAVLRDPRKGEDWAAQGCEIAIADMEDAAALTAAFAGAAAAFILPPPVFDPEPGYPEARAVIESVAEALRAAAPARILCLSTIGADAEHDNLLSQRTMMEAALHDLALPLTMLRPAWFADNAAWDVAPVRETGLMQSFLVPTDKPIPMVAAADVGIEAARLIQEEWQGTRVVELEGPRRVAPDDIAAAFARVLGRPVRAVAVPRKRWEALFREQGMRHPLARMRMLDGFNEGWIAFRDGGRHAVKGRTGIDSVVETLVAAPRQAG
ncbi:NmrA family NAD(P)-binding protein [Labrys wisconsinensis]|uniref:Uncharacterized protein YbjT (DUF2867 family) n=1 Tax=Labrys wisconsinensis TaxID=425677 RepID=A0ABU0J6E5_9HYPH|nr:NAD(P)H-binding protein [Labrys wisconsinensis]MDQ0469838.1 uncharacterized protein YbjT (DUF2867 family) [Labrys wisconsinensis]